MNNLDYCLSLVKRLFKIEATIEDIGYESILLEREELDPALLPENFKEDLLEDEILIHSYGIEEYVVIILTSLEKDEWKLVGVLKENELVYSYIPD